MPSKFFLKQFDLIEFCHSSKWFIEKPDLELPHLFQVNILVHIDKSKWCWTRKRSKFKPKADHYPKHKENKPNQVSRDYLRRVVELMEHCNSV